MGAGDQQKGPQEGDFVVSDEPTSASTSTKSPGELALEIYNTLLPHPSDVRLRAVHAALALFGESVSSTSSASPNNVSDGTTEFGDLRLGPKATKWLQRHGISRAMLDEVFHVTDTGVDVTASSIPGASKREKTINCY